MPLGVMRKHIKYYNFDVNTTLYIHQICAFIIEVMVLQLKQYK